MNRKYLQDNALSIMNNNMNLLKMENNTPLFYDNKIRSPVRYNGVNDTSKPFGYSNSILKEFYLMKERLQNVF